MKLKKDGLYNQSRPRSDAAEHGVWSGSTLLALYTEISIKIVIVKTSHPSIGNRSVQRVVVDDSTRRKWVKTKLKKEKDIIITDYSCAYGKCFQQKRT